MGQNVQTAQHHSLCTGGAQKVDTVYVINARIRDNQGRRSPKISHQLLWVFQIESKKLKIIFNLRFYSNRHKRIADPESFAPIAKRAPQHFGEEIIKVSPFAMHADCTLSYIMSTDRPAWKKMASKRGNANRSIRCKQNQKHHPSAVSHQPAVFQHDENSFQRLIFR